MNKLVSPSPKDALCQVWLILAQWFWRRYFNFVNVFWLFCNYPFLEKGGALHLKKLESLLLEDELCQVWLKLAKWFWRGRFLNFVNVFLLFCNYIPFEKIGAVHLNKTESLQPRMLCAKFGWYWPSGSWRRRFLNFVYVFLLFRNLPLENGGALHLNKLEFPSPKNALCQVWLKLAKWSWRRRF